MIKAVLSLISFFLYLLFFIISLYHMNGMFRQLHNQKTVCICLSLVNTIALSLISIIGGNISVLFVLTFVILFFECIFIYKGSVLVAYWYALSMVFCISITRGISSSILSLIIRKGLFKTTHNPDLHIITMLASGILLLAIVLLLQKYVFTSRNLWALISCTPQFHLVCIIESLSVFYLLLLSFSYNFNIDLLALSWFQLISCLSITLAQSILMIMSIQFSLQIEVDLKSKIIQAQLDRQLRHYDAYQKHVEGFRTFKRSYNSTTGMVRQKIKFGDYQGAIQLLDEADSHMQALSGAHKEYCNHPLLDAIFQDCAGLCAADKIQFSALVYVPSGISLSDLDYCRIFSNLCTNAIEGCNRLTENKPKYINFRSITAGEYLIVTCENPFGGNLRFNDNLPETSKSNKAEHGLGLTIVKNLAEENGGFVDIITNDNIFKISVHLPFKLQRK